MPYSLVGVRSINKIKYQSDFSPIIEKQSLFRNSLIKSTKAKSNFLDWWEADLIASKTPSRHWGSKRKAILYNHNKIANQLRATITQIHLKSGWFILQLGNVRRINIETGRRGINTEWLVPVPGVMDKNREDIFIVEILRWAMRSPNPHPRVPVLWKRSLNNFWL